jgi:hypothetical protein
LSKNQKVIIKVQPSRRTAASSSSSSTANKAKTMGKYYNGPFDFEIVGLYKNSYGRSCNLHTKCGEHLIAGDIVQLIPIDITNLKDSMTDNENEEPIDGMIKVMKLVNDIPQCIVGYIPSVQCNVLKRNQRLQEDNTTIALVNDIYQYSDNTYKVFTSERHSGMASCCICTSNSTTTK